jgi:hypothetical protein
MGTQILGMSSNYGFPGLHGFPARNMVQVASDHNGCAVLEKGLSYGEERQVC